MVYGVLLDVQRMHNACTFHAPGVCRVRIVNTIQSWRVGRPEAEGLRRVHRDGASHPHADGSFGTGKVAEGSGRSSTTRWTTSPRAFARHAADPRGAGLHRRHRQPGDRRVGEGLLEGDPVAALELENGAGLVRGRDLEPETLDDLPGELHLLGIRLREPAAPGPEAVLEADADVAARAPPPAPRCGAGWRRRRSPTSGTGRRRGGRRCASCAECPRGGCRCRRGCRTPTARRTVPGRGRGRRSARGCRGGRCRSTRTRSACRCRSRWRGCTRCP